MGRHTIALVPNAIATFLGLQDAERYTGHAFRRTSATWLADAGMLVLRSFFFFAFILIYYWLLFFFSGADRLTLKRHGRWSSDACTEGYLANSKSLKISVASMLQNCSSPDNKNINNNKSEIFNKPATPQVQSFTLNNCNNLNFCFCPLVGSSVPKFDSLK